jgi:alkylated DNA repair protein (DNA oxidative demethylase)
MTELPGFRHLAGYFGPPEQKALLAELRAVIEAAPLFVPRMPRSGKPFSVRMSNCGTLAGYRTRRADTVISRRIPKPGWPGRRCRAGCSICGTRWPISPNIQRLA